MNSKGLLESMLADGKAIAEKSIDVAQDKLGVPQQEGAERDAMLDGMQKGVIAAGALAVLLGTGAGRRLTGAAIKVGSVAAIGGLAYNAYNKWQGQIESKSGGVNRIEPMSRESGDAASDEIDRAALDKSIVLVQAMVAAAKADGHVDAAERKVMLGLVDQQQFDAETLDFLKKQISTDVTVAEIAALADSPELANEMYLACRVVIDLANPAEKEWLSSLAAELGLADELVENLEAQVSPV